ncbi:MAG TPA: toll/interleukin-1 receptor domain-containing protein [Pyrinomonadaceae bacterium]|nr:toll/interleukin-1 receptor domain-containing protein [Pyrinomonadaceae bacterium]
MYISYSAKDSELAKDLARRLQEAGVETSFVNSGIETNESACQWKDIIRMHVLSSEEVIVLLTDNSADSPWVRYEMGIADGLDKRLTPVVVNEGVEKRVPMVGKHFIKYADLPKYISSLKRRAKAA